MRLGAILILLLMLSVGVAPTDAFAHEGSATQVIATGSHAHLTIQGNPGPENAAFVISAASDAESPANHHDERPGSLHCLAFAGCGGVGVLAQSSGFPVPRSMAAALLDTAGSPPQGIDLPLEDRPPRSG